MEKGDFFGDVLNAQVLGIVGKLLSLSFKNFKSVI